MNKHLGFYWFQKNRGSRSLQNTIRIDLDTAGAELTFPNIEKPQYSCFWEFQCTTKCTR